MFFIDWVDLVLNEVLESSFLPNSCETSPHWATLISSHTSLGTHPLPSPCPSVYSLKIGSLFILTAPCSLSTHIYHVTHSVSIVVTQLPLYTHVTFSAILPIVWQVIALCCYITDINCFSNESLLILASWSSISVYLSCYANSIRLFSSIEFVSSIEFIFKTD